MTQPNRKTRRPAWAALVLVCVGVGAGCVHQPRPGVAPRAGPLGPGAAVAVGLASAAGAAIGHELDGSKGAMLGAGIGALGGAMAVQAVDAGQRNLIEEAREQGAREERLRVMRDYWQSHAISGGNGAAKRETSSTARQDLEYPAGVYDGVIYGPRIQEVPRP